MLLGSDVVYFDFFIGEWTERTSFICLIWQIFPQILFTRSGLLDPSNHVNSTQGEVLNFFLVQGFVCFFVALVKYAGFYFLYASLFLVHKLLQVSVSYQLVHENLQGLTVFRSRSFFFVDKTLPSLVVLLGVFSHGFGFSKVRFVSNSSEELMDWFFKNHVNSLNYSALIVN